MRAVTAILIALMAVASTASAETNGSYEKGDTVTLTPDKAYFLIRVAEPKDFANGVVLVRLLTDDELHAAIERKESHDELEPNVVFVQGSYPLAGTDDLRILLTSGKPGRYILAGAAYGGMSEYTRGAMNTCLCLGTVQFEAKAGVITDLGTLLLARDDKPSPFPELAGQVRGKSLDIAPLPVDVAIVPYAQTMTVPDVLANLPRQTAVYRAYGSFPNYFGAPIDRLAPLQGVLDYDADGHVKDLGQGK
jgi:hypothetical protein